MPRSDPVSLIAFAIGLKLALELKRWDDAREQLDGLLDSLVVAEAKIPRASGATS